MLDAFIALGSNLGDRRAFLDAALARLRLQPGVEVVSISTYHETEPVGGPAGQGVYLNAVAVVRTSLNPLQLLRVLQGLENQLGRVRAERFGPRTIDLDLLLYGTEVMQTDELTVPHPRMHERRFVLEPLVEIAPLAVHPGLQSTAKDLLERLQQPTPSRRDLTGQTAVVTGSTSGIGLTIARAFAAEGANICINGLGDATAIEAERARIEADFGVKCMYSPANMLKPDEIVKMVKDCETILGSCDILVNNAGIQFVSPIEDFPAEKWDAIIAINCTAAFHAIRTAVPGMKARKWGRIINTASAHSTVASPFKSAYVTAKHGLLGMTKTVALEVATFGITANCISPGYVWTPLVEAQIPDTMKARNLTKDQVINDVLLHAQPTKQFVTVDQVAALAVFLTSDAACNITGANLAIDGGWTAE